MTLPSSEKGSAMTEQTTPAVERPRTEAARSLLATLQAWAERYPDKFLDGWEEDIIAIEDEARRAVVERVEKRVTEQIDNYGSCPYVTLLAILDQEAR
jgi:hypothetical protein